MMLQRPDRADALRPTAEAALDAWAERVRSEHEQVDRCREIADPADFYAPVAERFRDDPRRTDDPVLNRLLAIAQPDQTWLDIGAGGGRYALPLALHVREVIAIDPSAGMLDVLHSGMQAAGIGNVVCVPARWPTGTSPAIARADVALAAHVGYDIERIGPFLDAMEAAAGRCVVVVAEGAMSTVSTLLWQPIHGEARIRLPALPELLTLLLARGRLPEVALELRRPTTLTSIDEVIQMARRQLWLRPGSEKDQRMEQLVRERATQRAGEWALEWTEWRIGIVIWESGG